jgi:hypothetical protein
MLILLAMTNPQSRSTLHNRPSRYKFTVLTIVST